MGRRLRLLVHRKNEFRKRYAKQRDYNVILTPSLPVATCITTLQRPLNISISLDLIEQAVLRFNAIQTQVKMLKIMPKGMCVYNLFRMG